MSNTKQTGRLAMRVEGNLWVAYYAEADTMDGAVFLGSIQMKFVRGKEPKEAFMELMRGAVHEVLTEILGVEPEGYEVRQAPESERSGRA